MLSRDVHSIRLIQVRKFRKGFCRNSKWRGRCDNKTSTPVCLPRSFKKTNQTTSQHISWIWRARWGTSLVEAGTTNRTQSISQLIMLATQSSLSVRTLLWQTAAAFLTERILSLQDPLSDCALTPPRVLSMCSQQHIIHSTQRMFKVRSVWTWPNKGDNKLRRSS